LNLTTPSRTGAPTHPMSSNANVAYKLYSGPVNDNASSSGWLGPQEFKVLNAVFQLGLVRFSPKELGLDMDRRNLHHILKRLVSRGILKKLARGLYQVSADLTKVLTFSKVRRLNGSQRQPDGTSPPASGFVVGGSLVGGFSGGCCLSVFGFGFPGVELFFDNVRGFVGSGVYVCGDRGRTLSWGSLGLFSSVSYAEVGVRVFNEGVLDVLDGKVVIYSNASDLVRYGRASVRVEWRPPRGFVRRNGVLAAVRYSFYELVKAWSALTRAILHMASGNPELVRHFARVASGVGLALVGRG